MTKRNLFTSAFNSVWHRYWRIRHDSATGNVVFETVSDNGSVPGAWTPKRYSEGWNIAAVPLNLYYSNSKPAPGNPNQSHRESLIFDNFRAAPP